MSTLKTDAIEAATGTNTDLSLDGKGSGVPDLGAGFKVGSVAGVPTASIRDDAVTTAKILNDAVTTAKILNDNVTLAKLAAGTDGELITWDASGDPATVAVGTATHVLTSNGAGAAPTFQAAAGGAWKWISKATASSSSTLTVTGISTTYKHFMIIGSDLVIDTDSAVILIRVGTSAGILTGTYYSYVVSEGGGTTYAAQASSSANSARIAANTGNATGEGLGFEITLDGVAGARWPLWRGVANKHGTAGTNQGGHVYGSYHSGTNVITQFQIYPTAGTFTSGEMNVYGLVTS